MATRRRISSPVPGHLGQVEPAAGEGVQRPVAAPTTITPVQRQPAAGHPHLRRVRPRRHRGQRGRRHRHLHLQQGRPDHQGRLAAARTRSPSATPTTAPGTCRPRPTQRHVSYGYDGLNLLTSRTASTGGGTLTYGYDKDGNLTSVTNAGGTTTYQYNRPGNLTKDPANGTLAYNDTSQLTSASNADGNGKETFRLGRQHPGPGAV